MTKEVTISAMLLLTASLSNKATASTLSFGFTGPGVSGTVQLTYGTATDLKYPQALEVTGISGTFSDSNNGLNIVNEPIGPLVPINFAMPETTNKLAPVDFSKFPVATGLPPVSGGVLTYDNLFYPGGSPPTASDYTTHGGILDIYGLLFNIGGGTVVDLWSNGDVTGAPPADYGVAVATNAALFDYVSGGVVVSPEPNALVLLAVGLLGLLVWRRPAAFSAK
jgi:hypothetical protein